VKNFRLLGAPLDTCITYVALNAFSKNINDDLGSLMHECRNVLLLAK
jgi:hypothetical protein